MHCNCGLAGEALDRDWTNRVARNWNNPDILKNMDGAVEVWCCPNCDAHELTVMRNGRRETRLKGGPELARYHDRSLIPDGVLVVCEDEHAQ